MRYAQKQHKRGFLVNTTAVFACFRSRWTLHADLFGVARAIPPLLMGAKTVTMARPPRNSGWNIKVWFNFRFGLWNGRNLRLRFHFRDFAR